jgi:hypothetical protein
VSPVRVRVSPSKMSCVEDITVEEVPVEQRGPLLEV